MAAVRSHAALFVCALLAFAGLLADHRALAQTGVPTAGPAQGAGPTYYPPPPAAPSPRANAAPSGSDPLAPFAPRAPQGAPVAPLGNVVPGNPAPNPAAPGNPANAPSDQNILEVRVVGNRRERLTKILGMMKTKSGRQFDQATLNEDVGTLARKGKFLDVKARKETVPGGVIVTIEVVEQPVLEYTRFLGNRKVGRLSLSKHTDLKKGEPLIPADVEAAKQKLEDYYRDKGFNDVQITILEGNRRDDHGAVFLINEGPEQKIGSIDFIGNTLATDSRLKTQVQSKPPILGLFRGQVDQKKMAEDVEKLTAYYRALGYFRARIGVEKEYNDAEDRLALTYVIDEGPRARVRSVKLDGVSKFDYDQLKAQLTLKEGDYYDQVKLQRDNHVLIAIYGGQGFCFADVAPEPQVLEDASALDLVYKIHEGARYRISRVNVHIKERDGSMGHTRQKVILNRLAMRPGDLIDVNKVDSSKRKLRASNLFANTEDKGGPPRIEFHAPGTENPDGEAVARKPNRRNHNRGSGANDNNARMQSPDPEDGDPDEEDGALRPGESVSVELEPIPDPPSRDRLARNPPTTFSAAQTNAARLPIIRPAAPSVLATAISISPSSKQVWDPARAAPPPPASLASNAPPAAAAPAAKRQVAPPRVLAGPSGQAPEFRQVYLPAAEADGSQSPLPRQAPQRRPAATPANVNPAVGNPAKVNPANGQAPAASRGAAPSGGQASPSIRASNPTAGTAAPKFLASQSAGPARIVDPAVRPASLNLQAPAASPAAAPFIAASVSSSTTNSVSTDDFEQPDDWRENVWNVPAAWPDDFQPRSLLARKSTPPRSILFRGQDPGFAPPGAFGNSFNPQSPGSFTAPAAPGANPGGGNLLGGQPLPPYAGGPAGPSGGSVYDPPDTAIPIDVYTTETQTGKFTFGAGVNSNAGLIGNITVDEQNFDWTKVPTSLEEYRNGTAWRGAGQRFNITAAPGTIVQRYSINFAEPYLFDTPVGFGISGTYFNRYYQNWTETRAGGRVSLMYQFTPDLSGSIAFSGEQVKISNPSNPEEPQLARVLGWSTLLGTTASITYDTRDNTFLATEGYYIGFSAEEAFGSFVFPRATADLRKYIKLHERPDGSGRHVVMVAGLFGIEGNNAPLYEHFFAGGIGSIRGFYYRGASTVDQGVIVGGTSQALTTVEYVFPITADDMLRGTVFCDAGVIEDGFNYAPGSLRVAPGIGVLLNVPALGPAPINVGIAIPVVRNQNDMLQYFYFSMGFGR